MGEYIMKFNDSIPDPLFNYYENRIKWLEEIGRIGIKDYKNKVLELKDVGEAVLLVVETKNKSFASYDILPDILTAMISVSDDNSSEKELEFIEKCIKPTMPEYIRITQQTFVQYAQHVKYNQVIRANYWPNYEDMKSWMEAACELYKKNIEN